MVLCWEIESTTLCLGRLFRHGTNFDFMISFKGFVLSEYEKSILIELVKKEISYSRKLKK